MIWLLAIISTYWPSSSSVCKLAAIKVWPMKWIISSNNNKWATSILIRKRTRNTKVKVVINMLITGAAIRQSAIAGSLRAREVWNYRLHWWDPTFVAFSHVLAHIQRYRFFTEAKTYLGTLCCYLRKDWPLRQVACWPVFCLVYTAPADIWD